MSVKSLSQSEIKQFWLGLWLTDESTYTCSIAEYYDLGVCGDISLTNR